ncbi:MAG: 50S ribosomal protein L21 [Rhodospirillales bacterium]|nr:MAG: 50S ribosomal protein L21 [Rhodospirillales bacterium]
MYAVIKTGGKQYKVAKNDVILVERLPGEAGATVELDAVLMVGDDKGQTVGSPLVAGAHVAATVLEQTRGDKIIVFKKKRRKNYRRKAGHRQDLTALRITDIVTGGKKKAAAKPAEAKAEPKQPEAKPAPAKKAETEPAAKAAKPKTAPAKKAEAKPAAKKAESKPTETKKAETKKAETKKAEAKPAAKKAPAKKPAAKKTTAKPAAAKKAPAKKAPAKKPAAKKKD